MTSLLEPRSTVSTWHPNTRLNLCYLDGRESFILIHFGGVELDKQMQETFGTAFVGRKCYFTWKKKAAIDSLITLVYETWSDQHKIA